MGTESVEQKLEVEIPCWVRVIREKLVKDVTKKGNQNVTHSHK